MIEILATLCAGTFFGASIYINLAQHPATLEAGAEFADKFFAPMYTKASTLQIALAVGGTVLGCIAWYLSKDTFWIIGAAFLFSVIPITFVFIKPLNDQLLDPERQLDSEKIVSLLEQWNPRHWVRSGVSFVAFFCYLFALAN